MPNVRAFAQASTIILGHAQGTVSVQLQKASAPVRLATLGKAALNNVLSIPLVGCAAGTDSVDLPGLVVVTMGGI